MPAHRFPLAPRALLERVRTGLAMTGGDDDDALRSAALRVTDRAEQVLARLEATTRVLERVALTELALVERMLPILDDLGALVRVHLDDARQRLLGGEHGARRRTPPDVIDVD